MWYTSIRILSEAAEGSADDGLLLCSPLSGAGSGAQYHDRRRYVRQRQQKIDGGIDILFGFLEMLDGPWIDEARGIDIGREHNETACRQPQCQSANEGIEPAATVLEEDGGEFP